MNPILILTKNNRAMNQRCVDYALNQDIPTKVYIHDNCSSDDTPEWLAQAADSSIDDISTSLDLGVSEGWNYGLNLLFKTYPHVLVINSDVVLPKWFFSTLLSYDEQFITGVSVGSMEEIVVPPPRKELIPHPDMSAFLIRKACWEKVGEFDSAMHLYASDLDFHLRAHRAGVRLLNCGCPFYHERSSTINNASPQEKQNIRFRADADRSIFRQKWGVAALSGPEYDVLFDEKYFNCEWKNKMLAHNTL